MTVAYAYFRYIVDRENHKSLVYHFPGPSDVPLIVATPARVWDDMENNKTVSGKDATEGKSSKEDGQNTNVANQQKDTSNTMSTREKKKRKYGLCLRILHGLFYFVVLLTALTLIAIAVFASLATKAYDTEQSSRLVGMVILAVTAAVTVSVSVYGLVGVIKNHSKSTHTIGVVLMVVVIIQALICGVSVKMSPTDEVMLGKSLTDSFQQSLNSNSRHVKLWALTQSDLNCCGIEGPDDYRQKSTPYYFPPNVPISCCSTYDKGRSELVQEREREYCKARETYYVTGCKNLVVNAFKDSATIVLTFSITLIIIEILLVLLGCFLGKETKKSERNDEEGKT